MGLFLSEIRHAFRVIGRRPGYALFSALVFALAVGTVTPTFSLVNAFIFRPLPFGEPDRLVHVWTTESEWDAYKVRMSIPDYQDIRREARSFEGLAAFNYTGVDLADGDEPQEIEAGRVSANFLDVLRREPFLGRGFEEGEDEPGADRVVLLSEQLWRSRYGSDSSILGRTIEIDGSAHTVVGVMPADFIFPLPVTKLWVPRAMDTSVYGRGSHLLQVVGRLAPGVSKAQALAELEGIAAALASEYPETNATRGVAIGNLRSALNFADEIIVMMAVVLGAANLLVLAIACANLSGLFLSRAIGRSREFSIRTALGGSRRRLVRLVLIESLVLAVPGAVLGLGLAGILTTYMDEAIPQDLYRVGAMTLDPVSVAFTIGLTVLAALGAGLFPAIRMSKRDLAEEIRSSGRSSTGSRERQRVQSGLVITEVALGVALTIAALVMVQTMGTLQALDPGFDKDNVLTMRVSLRRDAYPDDDSVRSFVTRVTERIGSLPGVEAVSTVNHLPLNHEYWAAPIRTGGEETKKESIMLTAGVDYLDVMGIPLLDGREFADSDVSLDSNVAVVTKAFADAYFKGQSPLGRTFRIGSDEDEFRIVGMAGDTLHISLEDRARPFAYISSLQHPVRMFRVMVRAEQPKLLAGAVREAIREIDPQLPVVEIRTAGEVVNEFLLPQRAMSASLGGLSLGAILLAAVGLYGLIAFFVAQHMREIGLRLALGASPQDVVRMIVTRGLRLAGAGALIGVAVALALVKLCRDFC